MRRSFVVLSVVLFVLAGCGDSEQISDDGLRASSSPPAADAEESPSPPVASPTDNEEGDTDDEVTTDDGLTGFGATRQAWDANHEPAPGYTEGAVYLPMAFEDQPKYAAVCCEERIILYTVYMEPGTSLEEAELIVSAEFPSDVTPGDQVAKDGGCTMQLWRSPTLQEAVGSDAVVTYEQYDDSTTATLTTGDDVNDEMC